ncbi:MAG: hypothetical protein ACOY5B_07090 [Spirochaetota bacterium]
MRIFPLLFLAAPFAGPFLIHALPSLTEEKFRAHLVQRFAPVGEQHAGRIFDCIDESQSAAPVRLKITNKTFNYFEPAAGFAHFLGEFKGWPLMVSFAHTTAETRRRTVVIPFRGDTFGYHKSFLTPAIIDYAARDARKFLVFPGEFIYVKKPPASADHGAPLPVMSLCHNRSYWFGRVGPEWPLMDEHAWPLLAELFPFDVDYEFIAYSNGTVSRNAFLRREPTQEITPYKTAGLSPKDYLDYYIRNHSAPPAAAKAIRSLIDIEGNFRISNDLFDLMAFIRDEIMPDKERSYYSIVRVDKPDAFPVNALMIRALGLQAIETSDGILRYTNAHGNVIMEVLGRNGREPYGSGANDLLKTTPVERYRGTVRRKAVSHFGIIDFALKREESH